MGKKLSNPDRVSGSAKLGYILGNFSYSFCMLVPAFITTFATENLSISILAVTTMMMLVKILDGITDILAGILIDKTKSPKGKARPWFLRMAVPYGITLAAMFFVPADMGEGAKIVLLGVLYALCVSVFGTVIGVAKFAIIPLMTDNQKERGLLASLGEGISGAIVGLLMAACLPMVNMLGWKGAYTVFGIVAMIASILCYALTREKNSDINDHLAQKAAEKVKVVDFFKALFRNKYALLIFVYVVGVFCAAGFMQTGGIYYWTYYVGNPNGFSAAMLANTLAGVVGIFVVPALLKRFTRAKTFMIGMAISFLSYLVVVLTGGTNFPVLLICFSLNGLGFVSIGAIVSPVMSADAVDYGEWKTGVRSEGVVTCVVNVGIKIGGALASFIMGLIMDAGGFVEGGVEQSASAIQSIFNMYIYAPLICAAVLFILIGLTYKLDKQYPTIIAELKARKGIEG